MRRRTVWMTLALAATALAFQGRAVLADDPAPVAGAEIPFELLDMDARTIRGTDFRGRWLLVFFGYTSCPDLCPTVLLEIAQALEELRSLAERVQPVFVSVDPQRDTPKILRDYLGDFDGHILPLTGTADQLERAAKSFGITFYKTAGSAPDTYTIAHSAIITLLGPEGGLVMRFSADAPANQIAVTLRKLMGGLRP